MSMPPYVVILPVTHTVYLMQYPRAWDGIFYWLFKTYRPPMGGALVCKPSVGVSWARRPTVGALYKWMSSLRSVFCIVSPKQEVLESLQSSHQQWYSQQIQTSPIISSSNFRHSTIVWTSSVFASHKFNYLCLLLTNKLQTFSHRKYNRILHLNSLNLNSVTVFLVLLKSSSKFWEMASVLKNLSSPAGLGNQEGSAQENTINGNAG